MVKRMLLSALSVTFALGIWAQGDDDTWLMDVGGGMGGSFYMGDANRRLYSDTNGSFMLLGRYNFNPRFAVRGTVQASAIQGSQQGALGQYPDRDIPEFSRTVYNLAVQAEWGFLGYATSDWMGGSRLAPYGLAGIGVDFVPAPARNDFAVDLPLGLGLRYKVAPRMNLGLEWTMHFTGTDRLDCGTVTDGRGFENPAYIDGKGIKNKDSYCCTMFYVSFDVLKKPCHCNDDD